MRAVNAVKPYVPPNGPYRYSGGFLYMYLEQFNKALKVYKRIAGSSYKDEAITLRQVFEFNENLIKNDSPLIQSFFILGYLKYKKERNYPEALHYLERFLEATEGQSKYKLLIGETGHCKREIEEKMQLESE